VPQRASRPDVAGSLIPGESRLGQKSKTALGRPQGDINKTSKIMRHFQAQDISFSDSRPPAQWLRLSRSGRAQTYHQRDVKRDPCCESAAFAYRVLHVHGRPRESIPIDPAPTGARNHERVPDAPFNRVDGSSRQCGERDAGGVTGATNAGVRTSAGAKIKGRNSDRTVTRRGRRKLRRRLQVDVEDGHRAGRAVGGGVRTRNCPGLFDYFMTGTSR
jgi:hypothetical protein